MFSELYLSQEPTPQVSGGQSIQAHTQQREAYAQARRDYVVLNQLYVQDLNFIV